MKVPNRIACLKEYGKIEVVAYRVCVMKEPTISLPVNTERVLDIERQSDIIYEGYDRLKAKTRYDNLVAQKKPVSHICQRRKLSKEVENIHGGKYEFIEDAIKAILPAGIAELVCNDVNAERNDLAEVERLSKIYPEYFDFVEKVEGKPKDHGRK